MSLLVNCAEDNNSYKESAVVNNNMYEYKKWLSEKREKFLIYNYDNKEVILGIGVKKRVKLIDIKSQEDFVFVTKHFFEINKETNWTDFGNEGIVPRELYRISVDDINFEDTKGMHTEKVLINDLDDWSNSVDKILGHIKNDDVEKVVMARMNKYKVENYDANHVLSKLFKNINSYVFYYQKGNKTFFGASPEKLVSKEKNIILIDSLAGTAKKGDGNKEWLIDDKKNNYEHRIVMQDIVEKIKPLGSNLDVGKTGILELNNLYHLQTKIKIESSKHIWDFVDVLHPTPALGGKPQKEAIELIKKNENFERGLYGAPFGYIDSDDGLFIVAIRSALLVDDNLYVFAGCGIVKGSDPVLEYEESNEKMKTIVNVL